MRKMICILSTAIILVGIFSSCSNSEKANENAFALTSENIQNLFSNAKTEKSSKSMNESVETDIGGETMFCNHKFDYHSINGLALDYINGIEEGAADRFEEIFWNTEDFNIRFFMEYFGIPKEKYDELQGMEFIKSDPVSFDVEFYNIDRWFSDKYYKEPYFLEDPNGEVPEWVMIRPPNDNIHTDRYFTIDSSLIDYVGKDKFEIFKEKYGGTEDFNVLNFIRYFNISKNEFKKCTETQLLVTYGIYNTEYVYGTEEMQKEYFEKHLLVKR